MSAEKKFRESVHKAHYWVRIDFEIRADDYDQALKRCAALFRRPVRNNIREGLVYMGAHSARVKRAMVQPKHERTIVAGKNKLINVAREPLPSAEEVSQQDRERRAATKVKKDRKTESAPAKPKPKRPSLLDIMGGGE